MLKANNDLELSGSQIKEMRKRAGLSQQEFGARLGVTHAHISKIESGKEKPSETLLRLIRYEFNTDFIMDFPTAEITKSRIKQYLDMLSDILLNGELSDGCLYNSEFLLSAYVTILKETNNSGSYQEFLLENLSGIIDEVALFIERNGSDTSDSDTRVLLTSKLQQTKHEILSCCNSLYDLLKERIE